MVKLLKNEKIEESFDVLIVADYPSPHLVDFFDALNRHPGLRIKVLFTEADNPLRKWGKHEGLFPSERIQAKYISIGRYRLKFSFHLLKRILADRPDLLVFFDAFFQPTTICAAVWLNTKKRKWGIFTEPLFERSRNKVTLELRKLLFRLLRRASLVFTTGTRAVTKWRDLLGPAIPIENLPYYRRLESFHDASLTGKKRDKNQGIKFLYCGQFIHLKRVDILVKCALQLIREGYRFELNLVGSGPMYDELRDMVTPEAKPKIHFVGDVRYEDMAAQYAQADVFVFPSCDDGWGMVVMEALAAGLPVISTYGVSSAVDFIRNRDNGFIVEPNTVVPFLEKMKFFLDNPEQIPVFSASASRIMEGYSPQIGAEKFYQVVRKLCLP